MLSIRECLPDLKFTSPNAIVILSNNSRTTTVLCSLVNFSHFKTCKTAQHYTTSQFSPKSTLLGSALGDVEGKLVLRRNKHLGNFADGKRRKKPSFYDPNLTSDDDGIELCGEIERSVKSTKHLYTPKDSIMSSRGR